MTSSAQAVEYLSPRPLAEARLPAVSACKGSGTVRLPVIAWGADIATSLANGNAVRTAAGSLLAEAGLDVELYRQDDFQTQVADYLSCKTPYLRGTVGMINMAAEVANRDPRTRMIVIYQLSWSTGGDAVVVKSGIERPADLKGKTIAIQAYGPHVDYMLRVLKDAGLSQKDVTIKWVRDLIQVDERSSSPAMALAEDDSVDAAFVIIPDALALTSGGTVGTGSEDSVKGAKILLSTKTANRIIADVYAVRADYLEANRAAVAALVNGLLRAQEKLAQTMKAGGAEKSQVLASAASLLLDSPDAAEDAAAMYQDAEFAGFEGNRRFFTDAAYPRRFQRLTADLQSDFQGLGLIRQPTTIATADWDYDSLGRGLTARKGGEVARFDKAAVRSLVQSRQQKGQMAEGELFRFEIFFAPNQNSFPADQYRQAFEKVIDLASTYGGALLTVEGHSDPLGYLRKKKKNESVMVLKQVKQAAKNLSYTRANAVKTSLIGYAGERGVTLDASQFGVAGLGVSQPNTPNCSLDQSGDIALSCAPATKQEWNATRRVVFRIIQVEAEADVFKPLDE